MWVSCKPQTTLPTHTHTHWRMTIPSQKMAAHEGDFFVALNEIVRRTESFTKPRQLRHTAVCTLDTELSIAY